MDLDEMLKLDKELEGKDLAGIRKKAAELEKRERIEREHSRRKWAAKMADQGKIGSDQIELTVKMLEGFEEGGNGKTSKFYEHHGAEPTMVSPAELFMRFVESQPAGLHHNKTEYDGRPVGEEVDERATRMHQETGLPYEKCVARVLDQDPPLKRAYIGGRS
jgi:hypothetical protein